MSSSVIAIDGPAASGKSTAAKNLAKELGIPYINTGSLYRAIAWKTIRLGVGFSDEEAVCAMLKNTTVRYAPPAPGANPEIEIDGTFPGEELRKSEVAGGASSVAVLPGVRSWTMGIQRDAAKHSMIVMEGRDIGTAVFPDARYKFFLTASPRVRALRRLAQDGETPDGATVESVAAQIAERDLRDSQRATAPLRQAEDAILVDSSDMTAEEVLAFMLSKIRKSVSASIEYQVPFADTDQMGVVYYANYLVFFEMARAELMRSISFSYTQMEKTGFGLPVLEAVCRYHSPAHFEDKLVITATLTEIKGVRLRVDCTVKRGDTLLAEGYTWHACLNSKTGRPSRVPGEISDLFTMGEGKKS